MKTSELLKLAKTRLSKVDGDGHYCFVCNAIDNVRVDSKAADKIRTRLTNRISRAIRPYVSVRDWLKYQHGIELYSREMQTYRHRWVDHLIAEYESKGD